MDKGADNRKHKRIRRRFTLRVASDDPRRGQTWSLVTAHNLSAGGVTFDCDQPFQMDQTLICKFQFMDRAIECKAKVVRFKGQPLASLVELAVAFVGLSDDDRSYIAHYGERFGDSRYS
jgi:hypothetical protein